MARILVELPNDYYLVNFRRLIDFVASIYQDLLSEAELDFQRQFNQFPQDAQRLYVRLLCRSRSVFRQSKLSYPEIGDIGKAADVLESAGFLQQNPPLESTAILQLFTRPELLRALPLKIASSTRRNELDNIILDQFDNATLTSLVLSGETLFQLQREEEFLLYRLCFFGNLYQDMTDFVLHDLGLTKFADYRLDNDTRAFTDRSHIDAHLQYYRCLELLDETLSDSVESFFELQSALPVPAPTDTGLKRRCDRVTNKLARELERQGSLESSLLMYARATQAPARERTARVLDKLNRSSGALACCEEILAQPDSEEEHEFALRFGKKIARKLDYPWQVPPRYQPDTLAVVLPATDASVEEATRCYYSSQGECFYTENALFNSVYGLVFWDIIFAPVPGVFFNPFQRAPADFTDKSFYHRRSTLIEQRFEWLALSGNLSDLVCLLSTSASESRIRWSGGITCRMICCGWRWPEFRPRTGCLFFAE